MATEIEVVSSSSSSYAKVNWKIKSFSELNSQRGTFSDVFLVGDYRWEALIFPKGWDEVYDHLSLYLRPVHLIETVETDFSFTLTSQTDPKNTKRKVTSHIFPEKSNNGWGIGTFMPLSEHHDPAKGYIVNDTCDITIEVACTVKEVDSDDDDSDKESDPDMVSDLASASKNKNSTIRGGDGGPVKDTEPDKVSELKRRKIKDEKQ